MRSKIRAERLVGLVILLAIFLSGPVTAQTKIQVVTKTITRKLEYKKDTQLRITAEKAKINVKGWDKNYIGFTLKLIGKHPEREVAEKELEHLQYYLKQTGNVHDLGNYFLIGKGTNQIKANLKAEYEILVPAHLPILINCKFSEIALENTKGRYDIDLEYGQLNLNQVEGEMAMQLVLSDVKSSDTNLILKGKAEKADMDFANASGTYKLENAYGNIRFVAGSGLRGVNIQASRTSVTFLAKNFDNHTYDVATSHAELSLPVQAKPQIKLTSGEKSTYRSFKGKEVPAIKILTTYSPVTIRNQVN